MKKIIEFILATAILWLPIVGTILAEWLASIITMDMIMTVIYISIPILILVLIKIETEEAKGR